MRRGFSLIEIIITILIIAIFISVIALVFQEIVKGLGFSGDTVKALSLARLELSKVNNLSFTDLTLADGYNNTTSNYESSSYDLNRLVSIVPSTSNNLKKVTISIYPSATTSVLAKLITYVADIDFGPGSGGSAPGGEDPEADSLTVTGGAISAKLLQNITLENTSTDPITITGVTITFTGSGGIKLKTIDMNGVERWSGTVSSGSTITFDTNFTLSASTTYSSTAHFTFSKNVSSATVTFNMSDATSTSSYSW